MRFDKFTLKLQEAFQEAEKLGAAYGHQGIDAEHILLALTQQPEGIVPEILKKIGVEPAIIDRELVKVLEKMPSVSGVGAGQAYMTPRLKEVVDKALVEAARLKDEYVSVEHVLIAIVDTKGGDAAGILLSHGGDQRRPAEDSCRDQRRASGSLIRIRKTNIRR